jgi:ABC-2 type transport system ATP-binding protein
MFLDSNCYIGEVYFYNSIKKMINKSAEIKSFLEYGDDSLAIRRLLDYSLEINQTDLLKRAISISKHYHQSRIENDSLKIDSALKVKSIELLEALDKVNPPVSLNSETLLQVNSISKKYIGGNFSLSPISLEIKTSDIVGIVGENGNGKTTLLRCLSGQLAIDSGSISYPRIPDADFYSVKNHVAFIPQRIPKWHGYLKDNLCFSASLAGIYGDRNELIVDFMLERLNLSKYAHLTWDKISSGYRTRFEIARVLLFKPGLLILDEPLANLDINAQQTILTDLRYLAKSTYHPLGIILSSQQLHEVEKVADRVLFIKQGKCLFTTGEVSNEKPSTVIELETSVSRDGLVDLFQQSDIQVQFNGVFYTLSSESLDVQQIIQLIFSTNIPITYFRDITNSTKRYFN